MKYAFKTMVVVLALGVLILQGCQTIPVYSPRNTFSESEYYALKSDEDVCKIARAGGSGQQEAYRRGLDCKKILTIALQRKADKEARKRKKLERKLVALEKQQKQISNYECLFAFFDLPRFFFGFFDGFRKLRSVLFVLVIIVGEPLVDS